jgi:hypothetical protein
MNWALYSIARNCNVNIAFQASHLTEENRKCTVLLKLKNGSKISLLDLALNLHPATQYLHNYSRQML